MMSHECMRVHAMVHAGAALVWSSRCSCCVVCALRCLAPRTQGLRAHPGNRRIFNSRNLAGGPESHSTRDTLSQSCCISHESVYCTGVRYLCTCVALEIREFARSGILYYLVRPVLFPEFTTQLTVAPRSRSLPDLKTRGGPRTTQMRVLRSGSYSQLTAVRPVGARAVARWVSAGGQHSMGHGELCARRCNILKRDLQGAT